MVTASTSLRRWRPSGAVKRGRPTEAGRPRGIAGGSGGHYPDPPASISASALATGAQRSQPRSA